MPSCPSKAIPVGTQVITAWCGLKSRFGFTAGVPLGRKAHEAVRERICGRVSRPASEPRILGSAAGVAINAQARRP